jgi:hypothetical protein
MNSITKCLVFALLVFSGLSVHAQTNEADTTTKQLYLITKTDGGQFYGYILKDDGREVLLETKNIGNIYISKGDIESIVKVGDSEVTVSSDGVYKDYRNDGPFTTRYYLTTNALPIKKGENYAMIHLYGPEVHFAVSDNLSLGVMSSWIASPIAIAAKYSFDSETNTHFALGTIMGSSGFLGNASAFGGLHWATVTQGDRKSNVSFSAGYGYINLGQGNGSRSYGQEYEVIRNPNLTGYNARYNRSEAALNKEIGSTYSPSLERNQSTQGAPVLSLSGITPIGKKASFIFDVMAFLPNFYKAEFERTIEVSDVSYTYYEGYGASRKEITNTEDVMVNKYILVQSGLQPTFLVMPGMRFNKTHNKAFQVVLAGVITKDRWGNINAFPAPMVSWLRTF